MKSISVLEVCQSHPPVQDFAKALASMPQLSMSDVYEAMEWCLDNHASVLACVLIRSGKINWNDMYFGDKILHSVLQFCCTTDNLNPLEVVLDTINATNNQEKRWVYENELFMALERFPRLLAHVIQSPKLIRYEIDRIREVVITQIHPKPSSPFASVFQSAFDHLHHTITPQEATTLMSLSQSLMLFGSTLKKNHMENGLLYWMNMLDTQSDQWWKEMLKHIETLDDHFLSNLQMSPAPWCPILEKRLLLAHVQDVSDLLPSQHKRKI